MLKPLKIRGTRTLVSPCIGCILVISGRPTWNLVAGLKIWINIHFGNTKKRHLFVFRKSAIFEFFFCKNSKNASYFLPLRKNTFWKHCLDFLQKKSCTIFAKLSIFEIFRKCHFWLFLLLSLYVVFPTFFKNVPQSPFFAQITSFSSWQGDKIILSVLWCAGGSI